MSYFTLPETVAIPYSSGGLEQMVYYAAVSSKAVSLSGRRPYVTDCVFVPLLYKTSEALLYAAVHGNHIHKEYVFAPDEFLKPERIPQPFVGDAALIEKDVKETFGLVTGLSFPLTIRVTLLAESEFRRHAPDPHVVGFSLNRKRDGLVSDVFVLAAEKDRVLLTIGHEIGHVLTESLLNKHCEEAKAFAFSRAWMEAIKKHDVAQLGESITLENPAQNGLHDVAFAFVAGMVGVGKSALDIFFELVRGEVSSIDT